MFNEMPVISSGGGGSAYSYQTANISASQTKQYTITDGYFAVYAGDNTWSYAHGEVKEGVCTFYQNVSNYASYSNGKLQISNNTNKTFVLGAFITDIWS